MQASGDIFSSQFTAEWAREKVAKRIINMAKRGERDPDRLSYDALEYLAQRVAPRKWNLRLLLGSTEVAAMFDGAARERIAEFISRAACGGNLAH